jgi:hypothetical protein
MALEWWFEEDDPKEGDRKNDDGRKRKMTDMAALSIKCSVQPGEIIRFCPTRVQL